MHEYEKQNLGSFFGMHLTHDELDGYVIQRINHLPEQALASVERRLALTKWFDYRFMHAALATFYFAQCYGAVYKRLYARHFDRERASQLRSLYYADIFAPNRRQHLIGFWRARQAADAIGMPYALFIELAMEKGTGYKRDYLPKPVQLYQKDKIEAAHAGWKARLEIKVWTSSDLRYLNDAFCGWPAQIKHREFILDQIARKMPVERVSLLKECLQRELITEELIAIRFGAETVERVLNSAS